MTGFQPTTPPRGSGRTTTAYQPFAPIEPLNMRSLLFLTIAENMLLAKDWTHRAVTVTMASHAGPKAVVFYGANHIDAIDAVDRGEIDFSILNPSVLLTMANRGIGVFDTPRNVATIALMPHEDHLGFALSDRLGFSSLADVAAAKYPLRVSTRGSLDVCTSIMIDQVLQVHGFSFEDLLSWGGKVDNDQPMPMHPTRMGRLRDGDIDAIFDEGRRRLDGHAGRRRRAPRPARGERVRSTGGAGVPARSHRCRPVLLLDADVPTVDYGGWPIYCRADASDDLVERFCRSLVARRDDINWQIGPTDQPPLPVERMVADSPDTPNDVPLHPRAREMWTELGWLT